MSALEIKPKEEWSLSLDKPWIISGPCSAESEEQVMETAKEIANVQKPTLLRAGIWKPRTRPNSFEGVGVGGLEWLVNAGREIGTPVTTEVANAQHVEACLKAGVDVLWLGARTTVNPFSVQEIADALKGVDIPVLVKNPLNPDLNLWLGALERINQAGITELGAIHRGFSPFEKTIYRNIPQWEFPIELKLMCPEIPIICDPSHIAGNTELLPFIAQKAMDLDLDGLMIESHVQPSVALSDAKQQVTPKQLWKIVRGLVLRQAEVDAKELKTKLAELRERIDRIDENIIQFLADRMKVAIEIGSYKKKNDVTILQVNRWDEIVKQRKYFGKMLGLSEEFMDRLLQIVHKESIKQQTTVMNNVEQE